MQRLMKRRASAVMFGLLIAAAGVAHGADALCPNPSTGNGEAQAVMTAVQALRKTLGPDQLASLEQPFVRESAIRWSNLPVGIVPRKGVRLGDLDEKQKYAARRVAAAALSACGLSMLDEVRIADNFLRPLDERKVGWDVGNYFLAILGAPSEKTPWMLQIGGHHLAYNLTFNGRHASATPMFFGSEPIYFNAADTDYEPLGVQSRAMMGLARALATHPEAKLSGSFTEVVKGVVVVEMPGQAPTGGTDTGFPLSYPTGKTDRGIPYSALSTGEQALVRAAIESYASLPGSSVAQPLVAAYESPAALAETYVGYSGPPDFNKEGSYVRIDGPRIWMEFVAQKALARQHDLADRTRVHFHALWRDKESDYGGEMGP
jgi:hypothetical protein